MKKLLLALTLVLCLAISMVAFTSCGGDGTGEDDGVCEHTWATEATVDTAATCTEEGVATIKCTACGEKKADSETVVPATGHTYGAETTVAPTCTEDGSVTKTCTACGDVNTTTTPATGHTWATEATVDTAATCTTDGSKSIKCTACNDVKPESTETIPATGHTWGTEATVDVEATCITEGSKSIKCTVCNAINPDTVEAIPSAGQHTWADEVIATAPTLFTEGLKTGTCSACNEALSEVLPKAEANLNAIDDTINNSKAPNGTMSIGDALGDKEFAPGVDLYLEYSVLFNETMANISGKGIGWGHIANNADVTLEGSTVVKSFSWLYHTADTKWCPFVGGFEFSEAKSFVYGPVWQANNNNADDFVIIEYGWHRVGLQYTQNVYENNGEFTYDVTATVYVDGAKVSEQIMDWGPMFYSAEIVDGETVYTQNPAITDYYVVVYRIGNPELDDGATEAYFPYGDVYLTAGNSFVMDVAPVENPEAQDFTQGEVTLPGKVYYAPVCYHDNADMTTTIAPTLFSEGVAKGTCPDCGEALKVVLPMTEAYVIPVVTATKDEHLVKEAERLGDVLADGQHFYPTEDNPNGNSLYVEFSILLNETMDNLVGSNISFPGIYADHYLRSAYGHSAFWFYLKRDSDGIDKGKYDDWTSNAVDKNNPDMYYNNQTALAFDGWHRIAVEFHQNDTIDYDNLEATSTMTVTMYIDGIKVYNATLGNGSKPADQELRLYTVTFDENNEVVYTDLVDSYAAYMSYNAYVTDPANPAYIPLADQYVTVGNDGFVLNVVPVADPAAATYEVAEGVEVSGKQYYKVERTPLQNLQDDTLTEYKYPMDKVVGTDGAIIYWGSGDNKNAYLTEYGDDPVGFYKNAFINITDTTFNYVTLVGNGNKVAGWAFITEMPEVGEKVTYVGNFATMNKFAWGVDKAGTSKIEIPEGAKYLVLYYEEAGNSYLPASITFTKEEKPSAEGSYSYPMDTIVPAEGFLNHGGSAKDEKAHYFAVATNNEACAFIDLTELDYNTVTLRAPANGEATNYTFLTKIPTEHKEKLCYATGYSDCIWFGLGDGDVTVSIPADATVLVVLNNYSGGTVTLPESIVFSNRDTTPAEMLKNDTLDSYEYPMTEIRPSMGTIASSDNKFIQNFRWVGSLVSIEGCVFDKIVFEIGATGMISYGFLTDYPTVGQVVSFAGETGMTTLKGQTPGTEITADIPDDAKVLVIYWQDWENNAPLYYIPESVTFIKAEDAGDITPPAGGDSDDSSEDAGNTGNNPGFGTDSDDSSEDAGNTGNNPGFGTDSDDSSEDAGTNNGGASEDADDSASEDAGTTPPIFSAQTKQ